MEDIPLGLVILAGFAGIVVWLASLANIRNIRIVLGMMLFFSAIGAKYNDAGVLVNAGWLSPLQLARSEAFLACGLLLGLVALASLGRLNWARTAPHGWFLVAIGLFAGLLRIHHESPVEGAKSLVFTAATFAPLALVVPMTIEDEEDWVATVRLVLWANMAYLAACLVQAVLDPSKLTMSQIDRFAGMSPQPISASIFTSISALCAVWLLQNDPKWRYRWLWIGLAGINGVLVIATGSRTGLVLLTLGLTALLYRRFGRAVLLAPLALASVWVAMKILGALGLTFAFDRTLTLDDTRTAAWLTMLADGMSSPLLGIGTGAHSLGGTTKSENSYLYGFASFGAGMMALMLVYVGVAALWTLRLWRRSFAVSFVRPHVDLVLAISGIYFALTVVDGHLLARADQVPMLMILFASLGAVLLHDVDPETMADAEEIAPEGEDDAFALPAGS